MKQIKEIVGIIYLTVNLVNGIGYVGYHHTSADDGYFGSGKIINNSIKKNGKEKFRRVILDHYCTKEEQTIKEQYWIDILNMRNRNIGYNIDVGGMGFDSGTAHPMWGKKGKDNPNTGSLRTKKQIEEMRNTKLCKRILINGKTFKSISEAGRILNKSPQSILYKLKARFYKGYIYVD